MGLASFQKGTNSLKHRIAHSSANRRKLEGATRLPKDFEHREEVNKQRQKEIFKLGAKCSFFKVTNMKYQRIITNPTCL